MCVLGEKKPGWSTFGSGIISMIDNEPPIFSSIEDSEKQDHSLLHSKLSAVPVAFLVIPRPALRRPAPDLHQ